MNLINKGLLALSVVFVPLGVWTGFVFTDAYNQDYARCQGYHICQDVVNTFGRSFIGLGFGMAAIGLAAAGYVVIDAIRTRTQVKKEAKA